MVQEKIKEENALVVTQVVQEDSIDDSVNDHSGMSKIEKQLDNAQ